MSNKLRTVLYVGVTNDLERRVLEHRLSLHKGFTSKYRCYELLYYEMYSNISDAIYREKQLKHWKREWKINLIQEMNPLLKDLSNQVISCEILDAGALRCLLKDDN